jgi:hypothetical protein
MQSGVGGRNANRSRELESHDTDGNIKSFRNRHMIIFDNQIMALS